MLVVVADRASCSRRNTSYTLVFQVHIVCHNRLSSVMVAVLAEPLADHTLLIAGEAPESATKKRQPPQGKLQTFF